MVTSRRAFIATALAGAGGGAYWWLMTRGRGGGVGRLAVPPSVPPTGRIHEYVLEAKAADWAPAGGLAARAWTYNGTVPGPEIRVAEGDRLRVTLRNLLEEPTSIHWHGLPVPFSMDGVPELTQPAVGAALEHLVLALCFATFLVGAPERAWSLASAWRRRSASRSNEA